MKNLLLAALIAHCLNASSQNQWHLVQQHPATFSGVYSIDAQNLWLSGYSNALFHSSDGGAQLQPFSIPDSYSFLNTVSVWNDSLVLIGGGCYFPFDQCPGNIVVQTDTTAANWQVQLLDTTPFSVGVVMQLEPHPDGQVYAVSEYGGIFFSPDLGANWTPIPVLPLYSIGIYSSVQFLDQQTGYVMGNKYNSTNDKRFRVFKTTDGGQEWNMVLEFQSDEINYQRIFRFTNAETGFVPGDAGVLYKTTDGGQNWIEQQVGLANENLQRIVFADDQTGYLTTYNTTIRQSKIYRTIDGGQNWSVDFQEDSLYLADMHFYDPNGGFAVTNEGHIFIRNTGNATFENAQDQAIAVFPNPAENSFQVDFDGSAGDGALLALFDTQGRIVLQQTLTQNREKVDCAGLARGVYFLSLTDKKSGRVGRGMIVLE